MTAKIIRIIPSLLLVMSSALFAQDTSSSGGDSSGGSGDDSNTDLTTYLQNLGKYFGYDVTQYCNTGGVCSSNSSSTPPTFSNWLLSEANDYAPELNLLNSFLGALLPPGSQGGSQGSQGAAIVSSTAQGTSMINSLAATTFANPPYSSASGSGVSVSALIDQQTYQSDPVSQAVLNLLSTPSSSYCMKNDGTWNQSCSYLYRDLVLNQVVGTLPETDQFFSYDYNQSIIPQLNPNTLLSPMLYSSQSGNASSTSSPVSSQNQNQGLVASNQMQQAANFIRYVSGTITPTRMPDRNSYDQLYSMANNLTNNVDQATQLKAQGVLTEYLTRLRTYTAQLSVGVGNLYYILSKRMPQSVNGSSTSNATSQALSEYTMATWRLYNPAAASGGTTGASGSSSSATGGTGGSDQQQWVAQINQASNATVQKEIALLLAEINYQLYLSRQQQERLLLTESVLLIQNAHMGEPDGTLGIDTGSSTDYQNPTNNTSNTGS